jgi:hypothetical protein
VVVAILGQDSLVGVVEILSSRAAAFSMEHVAELQRIAQLLVPILQPEEPARSEVGGEKRQLSITVAGVVFLVGFASALVRVSSPAEETILCHHTSVCAACSEPNRSADQLGESGKA